MKKILAEKIRNTQGVIIDVRSESEFLDGHVPTAVNIPLLNDAERVEVGTLYVQKGPEIARVKGLEIVEPKISRLFLQISKAAGVLPENLVRPTEDQRASVFKKISKEIMGLTFEENQTAGPSASDLSTDTQITQPQHKSLIFTAGVAERAQEAWRNLLLSWALIVSS